MTTEGQLCVYYPHTPVFSYMRKAAKAATDTEDTHELFFNYRHSLNVQTGQVKIYKNSMPIEHLTVDITEKEMSFELIDQREQVLELRVSQPFRDQLHLPIEISSASTHPLARRLREVTSRFPDLPHLKSFEDTEPFCASGW
jgi:hypothetical protein